ncbi:unnamed protein product [Calypogeia fissa]
MAISKDLIRSGTSRCLVGCSRLVVGTRKFHFVLFDTSPISQKTFNKVWDYQLYGELPKIDGGKEARMTHYFIKYGWPGAGPKDVEGRTELVTISTSGKRTFHGFGGETIASS